MYTNFSPRVVNISECLPFNVSASNVCCFVLIPAIIHELKFCNSVRYHLGDVALLKVCKFIILTWKTISTTWWVSSASCVFLYWLCWQTFVGLLISFSSLWSWTAFQWNYHESWMQQTYIICLSGEWPSSFHWKKHFHPSQTGVLRSSVEVGLGHYKMSCSWRYHLPPNLPVVLRL